MTRPRLVGPDRFGALFALLLLLFVVVPIVQESRWGFLITLVVVVAVLVVALSAVGLSRTVVVTGAVVSGGASMVVAGFGVAADDAIVDWVSALLAVMLFATTALVLWRIVFEQPRVTMSTVAGAMCAYLLVGMAFGALFRSVSGFDADAFTQELGAASTYFGFVTLTTLGYGDIAPVSTVARSLATLEAVIGQVLLVVLVARFVGMLGQEKEPSPSRPERARGEADDREP